MKAALPNRKESFKQTSLAELYNITENAHDALGDVQMLSQIIQAAGIDHTTMMRHAKTVGSLIQREKVLANKKVCQAGLQVLVTCFLIYEPSGPTIHEICAHLF